MMNTLEKQLEEKKRQQKMDRIFNHAVNGEAYFHSPSYKWKSIVLQHFNKIQRKEMSIEQLVSLLEKEGIQFAQSKSLIRYPVIDCLKHIAKISGSNLDL